MSVKTPAPAAREAIKDASQLRQKWMLQAVPVDAGRLMIIKSAAA